MSCQTFIMNKWDALARIKAAILDAPNDIDRRALVDRVLSGLDMANRTNAAIGVIADVRNSAPSMAVQLQTVYSANGFQWRAHLFDPMTEAELVKAVDRNGRVLVSVQIIGNGETS